MKALVSGALCGRHPTVAAVEICTRCGTFVCGECVAYRADEQPYCTDCLAHLDHARPSRRASVGLGLSIGAASGVLVGVVLPPLWLLALFAGTAGAVVSWVEVRAIARGDAPTAGLRRARAGRLIGILVAGLLLLAVAALVYVGFRAGWEA